MSLYDLLNPEQQRAVDELNAIDPVLRCYCGWYKLGECPHCQEGLTCADKLAKKAKGNE